MSRSRNFVFTLNNYTDAHLEQLASIECKYLGFGKEIGEKLTIHLQGVIVFETLKSLKQAIKLLKGAHVEVMKGNLEQAISYCQKEGDYAERGERPKSQKERGQAGKEAEQERWDLARRAAVEGRFDDIPSDIYIRHDTALHRIRQRCLKETVHDLDGELQHEWWYGAPGTGKTSKAKKEYPDAYIKDPQERWWDGYDGQEVVIIDDFDKYQKAQGGDMKRWLDRYVVQAPVKGGYMPIRPHKIIVTSNYHPDEIWDDEITQAAIGRRVKIVRFGEPKLFSPFCSTYKPLNH